MLSSSATAKLPTELLNDILGHLSPLEWKSLRLTSKSLLARIATEFLFRRVRLSALKCHYEAFIEISESPHLSQLPQQLVWYEGDTTGFDDETALQQWFSTHADEPQTTEEEDSNAMINHLCHELSSNIHNSIWTPSGRALLSSAVDPRLEEAWGTLLHRLTAAFDLLPNINTIISRPWPRDFVILTSTGGYEFTADVVPKKPDRPGICLGLILMLGHISKLSTSRVTSLYWADILWERDTYRCLNLSCLGAFEFLTSIDLCLGRVYFTPENFTGGPNLILTLYTARKLEHLKLCFERDEDKIGFIQYHRWYNGKHQARWERLSSFTLVKSNFRIPDFTFFLKQHTGSLRQLTLDKCICMRPYKSDKPEVSADSKDFGHSYQADMSSDSEISDISNDSDDSEESESSDWNNSPGSWKRLMIAIARIKRLRLNSIEITQDEDSREVQLVDADALVRFLNKRGPSPFVENFSYKFIDTHTEDEDFTLPAEYNVNDLEHTAYSPQSYWQLRRLRNLIIWWDEDQRRPGNYKTERWLFERRDGAFAYGRDPWEYFSDWESDDESDEGDYEESKPGNVVTETPFGPKFEAFCKVKGNGEGFTRRIDSDIWDLRFPDHAMVLLAGGNVMPWREYQGPRQKGERSWELVTRKPVRVRAEEVDE